MGIELYLKKKELNDQVIVKYKEEKKKVSYYISEAQIQELNNKYQGAGIKIASVDKRVRRSLANTTFFQKKLLKTIAMSYIVM